MGILSIINRNLLPNSRSKLKSLFPSSSWLGARISSSPLPIPVAGFDKTQVCAPMFGGDVNKHMFLIQHFLEGSTAAGAKNYSLLSIKEKSWKLLENNKIPGHGIRSGDLYVGCNGLYLSVVYQSGDPMPAEHLWNPITNEIKALLRSQPPRPSYKTLLADAYGMWFDPESKDYKVLRILQFIDEDLSEDLDADPVVEIYSLNTDSWREIAFPLACCIPCRQNFVCVNGIYYGATFDEDTNDNAILSFDFANEEFSPALIPLPEKVRPAREWEFYDYRLVEFDGALAVILHSELGISASVPLPLSFEVRVWNGESWTPRVPTDTFVVDVPGGVDKVLGLFGKDKLFLQAYEGELLLFDCKARELEYLGIHATPWLLDVFPHLECFVSLHPK